ncbi:MAG TPA: ABATE domain-containing protein [Gemmatimonadales bacterium]|jgi:predicted RNA-binding Zn ribbon-like protein|nr:ABATE domain-containing protein [Gemmatimonadales bacterium]
MPRRRHPPAPPPAPFVANVPWLDFVNTRFRDRNRWVDAIPTPRALATWLQTAGLAPGSASALAALRGRPGGARVLREAHALRASLAELAAALVARAEPPPARVNAINRVLRTAPTYGELRRSKEGFIRRAMPAGRDALALLGPVAESAADFLARGDRQRLRACGNPRCVLYFYDRTRNGHRRFCSASTCGNRVKAARRYHRLRAEQSG